MSGGRLKLIAEYSDLGGQYISPSGTNCIEVYNSLISTSIDGAFSDGSTFSINNANALCKNNTFYDYINPSKTLISTGSISGTLNGDFGFTTSLLATSADSMATVLAKVLGETSGWITSGSTNCLDNADTGTSTLEDCYGTLRGESPDRGQFEFSASPSPVEPTTITSTIGTSGRDYPSIQAWASACPSSLITANEVWVGVCYNDSQFVGDVVLSGVTTDSTHYRKLTVVTGTDQRHLGVVGEGASLSGTLLIAEKYFTLEHLRFTHPDANSNGAYVINCSGNDTAQYTTINSVLIHDWNCVGDDGYLFGIKISDNGGCKVLNTIITNLYKENTESDYGGMAGIYIGGSPDPIPNYVYNCIVANISCQAMYMKADGGIGVYDNKSIIKNCISMVRQYTSDASSIPNVELGYLDQPEDYKYDFTSTVDADSGYNIQQGGGYYNSNYMADLLRDKGEQQLWSCVAASNTGQHLGAVCYTSAVYLSHDYGETWETVDISATAGTSGTFVSIAISRNQTVVDGVTGYTLLATSYASGSKAKIFVSYDTGDTWNVPTGAVSTNGFTGAAMSDDGSVMVIRSLENPLKISNDYGKTFVDLSATWIGLSATSATSNPVTSLSGIPLTRKWKRIKVSEDGTYIIATVGGQATRSGDYSPGAYLYRSGRFWVGVSGTNGYTFTEIFSATNESFIEISDFQGCTMSSNGQYMLVSSRTGRAYSASTHAIGQVYLSNDYGQTWKNLYLNSYTFDVLESTSAAMSISAYGIANSPIIRVRTATPNRLFNDDVIRISGHQGAMSACNGTYKVTPIDSHTLELYDTYRDWRRPIAPTGVSGFGGKAITQNDWYSLTMTDDGQTMIATMGYVSEFFTVTGCMWQSDDYGETWYNDHDYNEGKDYQDIKISRDGMLTFIATCNPWDEIPDYLKIRRKTNLPKSRAEDTFKNPGPQAETGNGFYGYGFHAKDRNFNGFEIGYGKHTNSLIYQTQPKESGKIYFERVPVFEMIAGYKYVNSGTFGPLVELSGTGGGAFNDGVANRYLNGWFTYNNFTGEFIISATADQELNDIFEMVDGAIRFKSNCISADWGNLPVLPSGGHYVQDPTYSNLVAITGAPVDIGIIGYRSHLYQPTVMGPTVYSAFVDVEDAELNFNNYVSGTFVVNVSWYNSSGVLQEHLLTYLLNLDKTITRIDGGPTYAVDVLINPTTHILYGSYSRSSGGDTANAYIVSSNLITITSIYTGPHKLCIGEQHNATFRFYIIDRQLGGTLDLRIKNGSTCISAGEVIEGVPELLYDISGQPRGDSWDLGAFNYVPYSESSLAANQYYRNITIVS